MESDANVERKMEHLMGNNIKSNVIICCIISSELLISIVSAICSSKFLDAWINDLDLSYTITIGCGLYLLALLKLISFISGIFGIIKQNKKFLNVFHFASILSSSIILFSGISSFTHYCFTHNTASDITHLFTAKSKLITSLILSSIAFIHIYCIKFVQESTASLTKEESKKIPNKKSMLLLESFIIIYGLLITALIQSYSDEDISASDADKFAFCRGLFIIPSYFMVIYGSLHPNRAYLSMSYKFTAITSIIFICVNIRWSIMDINQASFHGELFYLLYWLLLVIIPFIATLCRVSFAVIMEPKTKSDDLMAVEMNNYFGYLWPDDAMLVIIFLEFLMLGLAIYTCYTFGNPVGYAEHGIFIIILCSVIAGLFSVIYGICGCMENLFLSRCYLKSSILATFISFVFVGFNLYWIVDERVVGDWNGNLMVKIELWAIFIISAMLIMVLRVYNNIYVYRWNEFRKTMRYCAKRKKTSTDTDTQSTPSVSSKEIMNEMNGFRIMGNNTVLYIISSLSFYIWPIGLGYLIWISAKRSHHSDKKHKFLLLIIVIVGIFYWITLSVKSSGSPSTATIEAQISPTSQPSQIEDKPVKAAAAAVCPPDCPCHNHDDLS